ncbi:hypothetical protein BJ138DRAFT_1110451 [Hygrophoropsis aurantiaca]|uniref:Uncharacterized protein n=1 Tax=Hygrophoropsis aurantiaca TaxID=72124 RepID=A0ACB8APN6_9AGAM|nr:hypothetical protein BJ138DRAFT_1110451 [Hygrophoropsis aurantiaca]
MPTVDVTTVATTYGSILLGTCFASGLSGIVFVQCVLYFKLYSSDYTYVKLMVIFVWALDFIHTALIVAATWQSLIGNFNKPQNMDIIPESLGLSVAVTAALTFLVHCFFADRIRKLTKCWYLSAPIVFLAFLRLLSACVSTAEIIRLKHYSEFIKPFPSWVFTLGVTLSASVELIITCIMVIFLGKSRTGFENMNYIINSLILYTLETGGITWYDLRLPRPPSCPFMLVDSAVTIVSLVCWMVMRHNLIFLGLHFAIAKLYANSMLATLNTRKRLRNEGSVISSDIGGRQIPLPESFNVNRRSRLSQRFFNADQTVKSIQLNVNVETTIVSKIDEPVDDDYLDPSSCESTKVHTTQ